MPKRTRNSKSKINKQGKKLSNHKRGPKRISFKKRTGKRIKRKSNMKGGKPHNNKPTKKRIRKNMKGGGYLEKLDK
jgi:hypothetical protein